VLLYILKSAQGEPRLSEIENQVNMATHIDMKPNKVTQNPLGYTVSQNNPGLKLLVHSSAEHKPATALLILVNDAPYKKPGKTMPPIMIRDRRMNTRHLRPSIQLQVVL
jgi:hypothetical protein